MFRVAFKLEKFSESPDLLEASCMDYIYVYPAQAKRGLIGGLGISTNPKILNCLSSTGKDLFKFYNLETCVSFLFLGETFYFDKLLELFHLTPFIVRDGEIVYFIDTTDEELKLLKDYKVYVEKNVYCEYYDENINGLNPFLQLVNILTFDELKKEYLITAIKNGFTSKWIDLNDLPLDESNRILSKLQNKVNVTITSRKHAQKLLVRYLDEFVNKYRKQLFSDIFSVSFSADPNSALVIFRNVYNALRSPETKERVLSEEVQPELKITRIEIHFKLLLPNDELANKIVRALKKEFENAELIHKPIKRDDESIEPFYRFSVRFNTEFDYYNIQEFVRLLHYTTGGIVECITKNAPLVRISRMLMWIKKVWFKITAPLHFREAVLESLNETKWLITSLEEKKLHNKWILEGEAWCDYQIFKPKKSIVRMLQTKEEIRESDMYYFAADRTFLRDCMKFFTAFSKNVSRRYPDVLLV